MLLCLSLTNVVKIFLLNKAKKNYENHEIIEYLCVIFFYKTFKKSGNHLHNIPGISCFWIVLILIIVKVLKNVRLFLI